MPSEGEGVRAPPVHVPKPVPSAEPQKRESEGSAGVPVGSGELDAAGVPPPQTFSTCGCYINGGKVPCSASGSFAKGALKCPLRVAGGSERRKCNGFATSCHPWTGLAHKLRSHGTCAGKLFSATVAALRLGGNHSPLAWVAHGAGLGSPPPLLGLSSSRRWVLETRRRWASS